MGQEGKPKSQSEKGEVSSAFANRDFSSFTSRLTNRSDWFRNYC
jgi:hypothetical protein